MPSLYVIASGAVAASADLNQLVNTLTGNQNTPVNVRTTDPIAYTFQGQNTDAAGKTLLLYGPDGTTVILRSQGNGVVASPDGTAAAPIVTTTHPQTVSGKTFTAPALNNPVVSGAGAAAVGTLGFSGTSLLVGDGTVIENVGPLGAWTAFTPTLTQGVALTLSTATGRYMQIGKLVIAQIDLIISGAGTAGQSIVLGALPVNARAPLGAFVLGHGRYFDGTTRYTAELIYGSATSAFLQSHNVANLFGITPAVTAANTHQLAATLMYEAA